MMTTLVAVAAGCAGLVAREGGRPAAASLLLEVAWERDLSGGVELWGARQLERSESVKASGKDLLLLGTSTGEVLALRGSDGLPVWSFTVGEACEARPTVWQGLVLTGCTDGVLYALELGSGAKAWTFDTGASIEAAVAVDGGLVVVTNSMNRIFALDAATGEFKWRKERGKVNDFTMYGHAAPLVVDGAIHAGFSDGQLMTYELADGGTRWGRDLSAGKARFRDLDATPVVHDGDVFAASFAGGLYRLAGDTGEVVWHREVEGVTDLTAHDGVVYFAARDGVHAVDSATGEDFWLAPIDQDDVASAPTLGSRYVYVALRRRGLLVLERRTGALIALIDRGSAFSARPTLADGRLFALSNAGTLYGFGVVDEPLDR